MKKVLVIGAMLSSLLMAEGVDRAERMVVMHGLENAVSTIQKGFFRNNEQIIELGATSMKEYLTRINSFVIEPAQKDADFNPKEYAKKETEALMLLADAIPMYFKQGKKDESRGAFDAALNRCITCHKIIRKW